MSHPPSSPSNHRLLPFERLDAYRAALALVELVSQVPLVRGTGEIRDQLRRACASVALNIAEGSGKRGADRRRFHLIARGSATEAVSALQVLRAMRALDAEVYAEGYALGRRLYAMLTRMAGL